MSQASSSTAMLIVPPEAHGYVASIAKAYYGIAGAVLSSVAATYFKDQDKGFILFASFFMSLATAFGGLFINLIPEDRIPFDEERKAGLRTDLVPYFWHFCGLILAILLTAALYLSDNSGGPAVHKLFGTLVLLWLFAVYAIQAIFYSKRQPESNPDSQVAIGTLNNPSDTVPAINGVADAETEVVVVLEMKAEAMANTMKGKSNSNQQSGIQLTDPILEHRGSNSSTSVTNDDNRGSLSARNSVAANYKLKHGQDLNVSKTIFFLLHSNLYYLFSFQICFALVISIQHSLFKQLITEEHYF
jgi:hypothetical protein